MSDPPERDRSSFSGSRRAIPAPTVAVPGFGPSSAPVEGGAESAEKPPAGEAVAETGTKRGARPPEQGEWCRNCDTKLVGPYCSGCGQRADEYSVSLAVLARDAADEYLSFDSRLLRTIIALVLRPGYLTRQYLIGRRARYVRPLRLYIVASLLFFLSFSFFGGGFRPNIQIGDPPQAGERSGTASTPVPIDSVAAAERAEIADAVARDISRDLTGGQTFRVLGIHVIRRSACRGSPRSASPDSWTPSRPARSVISRA